MGYTVRTFCTAERPPDFATVLRALSAQGRELSVEGSPEAEALASPDWRQWLVGYEPGKTPLLVECYRRTGAVGEPAAAEIGAFLERIGPAGRSTRKRRVIEHLKATRFIIACELPEDVDDQGFEANGALLRYFVEHCGGLIHADGEGFYDGRKLILPEE